jgi:D-proline reductase (dithiol) PrdB
MARLTKSLSPCGSHLASPPCPSFENTPWVSGKPLSQQRISLISTAGLHRRDDRPFTGMSGDYRVIPGDINEWSCPVSFKKEMGEGNEFEKLRDLN